MAIIGIDLGTTNCCIAVLDSKNLPKVIESDEGGRTIPSFVSYLLDGDPIVGKAAMRQAVTNPESTIFAAKRLIGRKVSAPEVKSFAKVAPYKIVSATNGDAWIRIHDLPTSPQEVSAELLRYIKIQAENFLGEPVTQAVVTVPAYFNDGQRQATKDAGLIAGVEIVRILNEPTAAALAYGLHRGGEDRKIVAVFDLGGGTFDISIMSVENGIFEVLATGGDDALGGNDWDQLLVSHMLEHIFDVHRIDLGTNTVALGRIKEAVRDAKIALSSTNKHDIRLPYIGQGADGNPIDFEYTLTAKELETITEPLCERLARPCREAIAEAGIRKEDLTEVLLVGGMTRSAAVQRMVKEVFGREPSKGANPDEVVALGSATYAGILAGKLETATLLDVTPYDIGIRVGDSKFSVVVPRNSMLPTRVRKLFVTAHDNQQFVRVELYQGTGDKMAKKKRLGVITLDDLPAKPAGAVKVELVMTIDVESIMRVTAKELSTGKKATVRVQPFGGLSREQIGDIIERRRVQ